MQQNVATAVVHVNLLAYLHIRKKGTIQTEQFCRVTQADVRATVVSHITHGTILFSGKPGFFLTLLDFRASYAERILSKEEVFHIYVNV